MVEIVKFEDGTYGIRKGNKFFGYAYIDLVNPKYTWRIGDNWMRDCRGTLEQVKRIYGHFYDKGRPIKEHELW